MSYTQIEIEKPICPHCSSSSFRVKEDVSGAFYYEVDPETGRIDWDDKTYEGDSYITLECQDCGAEVSYETSVDDVGETYITEIFE